ncbi:hypothetical protein [Saccharospirillum mangrovi]|uniref:hypothetical protein n=1 Tax=Saccharospirillum mangrovi TaxID=2161747 RepID=UPI001300191C|nr:hypothetical protein [Saccharospirillum mangrovi]
MISYIENILIPRHASLFCSFADADSQYEILQKFVLKFKRDCNSENLSPPEIGIVEFLELTIYNNRLSYFSAFSLIYEKLSSDSKTIERYLSSIKDLLPNHQELNKADQNFIDQLMG